MSKPHQSWYSSYKYLNNEQNLNNELIINREFLEESKIQDLLYMLQVHHPSFYMLKVSLSSSL
jgi:hypothetical protein